MILYNDIHYFVFRTNNASTPGLPSPSIRGRKLELAGSLSVRDCISKGRRQVNCYIADTYGFTLSLVYFLYLTLAFLTSASVVHCMLAKLFNLSTCP